MSISGRTLHNSFIDGPDSFAVKCCNSSLNNLAAQNHEERDTMIARNRFLDDAMRFCASGTCERVSVTNGSRTVATVGEHATISSTPNACVFGQAKTPIFGVGAAEREARRAGNVATRQPLFAVEYFGDATVEVAMSASLSVENRYAHLTQLLRDLRGDAAWLVFRVEKNETCTFNDDSYRSAEIVGNLTRAIPEMLCAHTEIRFRLVPCATSVLFAESKMERCFDFQSVEQARFEAQRIGLTHAPSTRCTISLNHVQCAQTTTSELAECLETTLRQWRGAADASMIVGEPVVSVVVHRESACAMLQSQKEQVEQQQEQQQQQKEESARRASRPSCSPPRSPSENNTEMQQRMPTIRVTTSKNNWQCDQQNDLPQIDLTAPSVPRQWQRRENAIRYDAPPRCERQTETQAIYNTFRGASLLQPRFNNAQSIYNHHEQRGFLSQQIAHLASSRDENAYLRQQASKFLNISPPASPFTAPTNQLQQHVASVEKAEQQSRKNDNSEHADDNTRQTSNVGETKTAANTESFVSLGSLVDYMSEIAKLREQLEAQAKKITLLQTATNTNTEQ